MTVCRNWIPAETPVAMLTRTRQSKGGVPRCDIEFKGQKGKEIKSNLKEKKSKKLTLHNNRSSSDPLGMNSKMRYKPESIE
jgi:hypothetical protein